MKAGFFYDYDLTLTEEFQQFPIFRKFLDKLKERYGIKSPDGYWSLCLGRDLGIKWMEQFLIDAKSIFGNLTNEQMQNEFAPQVKLAPGLPSWFKRLEQYASSLGIEVENHVITTGISSLVRGSSIYPHLTSLTGGEFLDDGKGIYKISSIVEPFRKVEHFKRICKGGDLHADLAGQDYHFNHRNTFYFGDGQSDLDLFRYLKQRGGFSVAVYKKGDQSSFDKCVSALGSSKSPSVNLILPRDYNENSLLERTIFQTLRNMSEAEKNCDMDGELVNNWRLDHIRNKKVRDTIEEHFSECSYCQERFETQFVFE